MSMRRQVYFWRNQGSSGASVGSLVYDALVRQHHTSNAVMLQSLVPIWMFINACPFTFTEDPSTKSAFHGRDQPWLLVWVNGIKQTGVDNGNGASGVN